LPIFTDFSDFLGRLRPSKTAIQKTPDALGVGESSSPRRTAIRRNYKIRSVVLFEENSILPLLERSEACWWHFFIRDGFGKLGVQYENVNLGKKCLTRLQAPLE
jgi:hypothetical protein